MKIQDLIQLTEAKLQRLNQEITTALTLGNSEGLMHLYVEVAETENTLTHLKVS